MNYKIIRVKDGEIVDACLTETEANQKIIFYDSPEEPHRIEGPEVLED